jgi:hypothetical protein
LFASFFSTVALDISYTRI